MIDKNGFELINKWALETKKAVESNHWTDATELWSATENVIYQATNNIDFYNILNKKKGTSLRLQKFRGLDKLITFDEFENEDEVLEELMNGPVREKLELNSVWSKQDKQVFQTLKGDFMKPVIHVGRLS